MANFNELDIGNDELISFLTSVWEQYATDFREYGKAHIKRRIRHRMTMAKYQTFEDLITDVLQKKAAYEGLFGDFSINVTELYRDPKFWEELQAILLKKAKNQPLNIWVTACASGEEVFSLMMMMDYYQISYNKIIATDFNKEIVEEASKGNLDPIKIEAYKKNLSKTNIDLNFDDYFQLEGKCYHLKPSLLSKIEFVTHNLMDKLDLGTFDVVMCRNVLIYFEKNLQNRVIKNLSESLNTDGILCLGSKESLRFMDDFTSYKVVSQSNKIYQKK
ncbi:MAG: hypothetical protein GQ527_03180 [Bacteroidales bacterium]|nr:hypothetical protein [Bacteroidales bacterium]